MAMSGHDQHVTSSPRGGGTVDRGAEPPRGDSYRQANSPQERPSSRSSGEPMRAAGGPAYGAGRPTPGSAGTHEGGGTPTRASAPARNAGDPIRTGAPVARSGGPGGPTRTQGEPTTSRQPVRSSGTAARTSQPGGHAGAPGASRPGPTSGGPTRTSGPRRPGRPVGGPVGISEPRRPIGGPVRTPGPRRPIGGPGRISEPGRPVGGPGRIPEPGRPIGGPGRISEPGRPVGGPGRISEPGRPVGGPGRISGPGRSIGGPVGISEPRRPVGGPVGISEPGRPIGGPVWVSGPGRPIGGPVGISEPGRRLGDPERVWEPGRIGVGPAGIRDRRIDPLRWTGGVRPYSPFRYGRQPIYRTGAVRGWGWGRERWPAYGRRWPWLRRDGLAGDFVPDRTVSWAQGCLAQLLGPGVPQDGILGPATAQAIAQFQMQQQLPPTGQLDTTTSNALMAACGAQQETAFPGGVADEEALHPWHRPMLRGFDSYPPRPLDSCASCRLISEDFAKLSSAVEALKDRLRRPPDRRRIQDAANLVIGISQQIIDGLREPHDCGGEGLRSFASLARAMLDGDGSDTALGGWPPPRSAAEHEARRQARASLDELLNRLG
jgi:hypothetical protein